MSLLQEMQKYGLANCAQNREILAADIRAGNIGINTNLDAHELFKVIHVMPETLCVQSLTTGLPSEISAFDFWVILDALPA